MKTIEEIQKFLEQPIPRDEVSTRKSDGKSLSYLESWKVIDLLNEAFGNLGWDSETISNDQVNHRYFDKENVPEKPIYVAKVRIKAIIQVAPGQFLNITKEGTGYGVDKSDTNPHGMAAKEAESDALKRAAMKFGKRLGLALYDRTQEFISDEKEAKAPAVVKNEGPASPVGVEANKLEGVRGKSDSAVPSASPKPSRDLVNKSISAHSQVVLGKKIKTQTELLSMLGLYGAKTKEDLSDKNAEELLNQLKGLVK